MKLPRFIATTAPPRETGIARAQDIGALTRTGTAEFEAIERAGGKIQQTAGTAFQAWQNRRALDDQAFAGEADKRAFDAHKEGIGTYNEFDPAAGNINTNDPKNYYDGTKILSIDNPKKEEFLEATYKDYAKKIDNLAKGFKNPKTRQAFINRWGVEGYTDFKEVGNAKLQAYHEQLVLSNAKAAARAGDIETANKWIDIAEKHGLIGPKKAAAERKGNSKLAIIEDVTRIYRDGDAAYEAGNIEAAEELYSEARNRTNDSSLKETEKVSLHRNIDTSERNATKENAAQNRKTETELHDGIIDGTLGMDAIRKSNLPAEAKRRLERDIGDVAARDLARNWAIQDTFGATTQINAMKNSLEAGQVDINESRSALAELSRQQTPDGRSVVSKATFNKTMEIFGKEGRDAIDLFTDEQTDKVTNFLISRLTDREARLRIRSEARTLTPKEQRQFSTTGFMIQVAKHQLILYKESVANRLRVLGIEDTSGTEAKAVAVEVWDSIKTKPTSQRINDFLSASGQKLVRPLGIPKDLWESSDGRTKVAIVNGVSEGFDNERILEALNK